MNVHDVIEFLNEIAPFEYGESFDNNGLLVGTMEHDVNKVMIALDLTTDVVETAIDGQFDLIITHHPYIFEPIKKVTDKILLSLIQNNIAYIATHTNYDNGRLRDAFAKKLQLKDVRKIHEGENGGYFGGMGSYEEPMTISDFVAMIKENFDVPYVKMTGEKYDDIKTVAFGNGSLSYYIDEIIKLPCDVYVTGEVKYHDEVAYTNHQCFVISIGHYESEELFCDDLLSQLQGRFASLEIVTYQHNLSCII